MASHQRSCAKGILVARGKYCTFKFLPSSPACDALCGMQSVTRHFRLTSNKRLAGKYSDRPTTPCPRQCRSSGTWRIERRAGRRPSLCCEQPAAAEGQDRKAAARRSMSSTYVSEDLLFRFCWQYMANKRACSLPALVRCTAGRPWV